MDLRLFVVAGMVKVMGVGQMETAATGLLPALSVERLAMLLPQVWRSKVMSALMFTDAVSAHRRREYWMQKC